MAPKKGTVKQTYAAKGKASTTQPLSQKAARERVLNVLAESKIDARSQQMINQLLQPGFARKAILQTMTDSDETSLSTAYETYQRGIDLGGDRRARLEDYEDMDEDSIITSALNIYASEVAQHSSEQNATVWIASQTPAIKEALEQLLDEIDLEDYAWGICRDIAKNGEDFTAPLYNMDDGVVGLKFVDAEDVEVEADKYGRVTGYKYHGLKEPLPPWDLIHWRIIGKKQSARRGGALYGSSMLEPARKVWRQLRLMEDAMILYRLEFGTQRLVFKIDVGDMAPDEAMRTVRLWQRAYKKRMFYNPQSGEFSSRHSPLALDQSIFWPVKQDSNSDVTTIGGDGNVAAIEDIVYLRNKEAAALNIPLQYLGGTEYVGSLKGLAQLDVQFARNMKRLQRAFIIGLTVLCATHLRIKKIPFKRDEFRVRMASVSNIEHAERIENMQLSMELADQAWQLGQAMELPPVVWKTYILKDILQLPDSSLAMVGIDPNVNYGAAAAQTMAPQQRSQLMNAIREVIKDPKYNKLKSFLLAEHQPVYTPSENEIYPDRTDGGGKAIEENAITKAKARAATK